MWEQVEWIEAVNGSGGAFEKIVRIVMREEKKRRSKEEIEYREVGKDDVGII
ncbi:MAG: hypothetical protein LE168_05475 [Endomicrobium sp.]|nr:hypothetical protein [Endomicrobium sp.]